MAANAPAKYTARLEGSAGIIQDVEYEWLAAGILELTVRAAMARSRDESEWEHEELRRRGLGCLQIFRNGKAIWSDCDNFEAELAEAKRSDSEAHFKASNELDPAFLEALDRDIRRRWRLAGYEVPSLLESMKVVFSELEADAKDRIAHARQAFADEILTSACGDLYDVRSVSDGDSPNISR
ncbi:MAG TPA: hypothetical protein VKR56_07360 [Candidatus Cybelea sp.]|nr:hypothetical protein [Candidatus Cybelea sp.]